MVIDIYCCLGSYTDHKYNGSGSISRVKSTNIIFMQWQGNNIASGPWRG